MTVNKWRSAIGGFLLIAVIGLGLNELIMYACSDLLGLHYLLSKIVATVIVFFWNFLARRVLVVRTQKRQRLSASAGAPAPTD